MKEESKIILYKELMKFEKNSKMKDSKIIGWEEFMTLGDRQILEYVLNFRDEARENAKEKVDKKEFFIEFPDMELEGTDLEGIYIHDFMAGYAKERNNGKKIFITTKINLKDTKCTINLATIRPIIISDDGKNIKEIVADVTKCDFRGCKVFGKFQNSKARLQYKKTNLPKEYIDRLEKYKIPEEDANATDLIYLYMLEKKNIRGVNGLEKVKQLVDFDLSSLKENIWKYSGIITRNKIDISYSGAFISEQGLSSIGRENFYIDPEVRAKEAYKNGDYDYIEKMLNELDKETRNKIVTLAMRDGKIEFANKHIEDLTSVQRKYLDLQKQQEHNGRFKKELENNNIEFLYENYEQIPDEKIKEKVREHALNELNFEFIKKHFTDYPKNTQRELAINHNELDLPESILRSLM